jgi:hypothetical protein
MKYHLVDDNDNAVGFVVVNAPQFQEMQSIASTRLGAGYLDAAGPVAESVLFLVIVGGCAGMVLVAGAPGWSAAGVGIVSGLAVASIRAWRSAGVIENTTPASEVTTVQVEQVTADGRHWVLDEFDPSLTITNLRAVARGVIGSGYQWTRTITTKEAGLSQGKHNKLQDALVKLRYLEPLPNNANGYQVTRFGRRFFEAVTALPLE